MPILDSQMPDLMRMIAGTAEAIGGQLTPTAAAVIAGDLRQYDLHAVSLALAEVRRTARGRFSLSDVLRIIGERDGRPHGDEAWAIALDSFDESATVVITEEIQMAVGVAQPVVDSGDRIGGRRTFLAAYDRLVGEARSAAKPCVWTVSVGTDKFGRGQAIENAVQLGRLTRDQAGKTLAMIGQEAPATADGLAIAGLITGKPIPAGASEKIRENLRKLRDSIGVSDDSASKAIERQERAKLNAKADAVLGITGGALPLPRLD
jgi:hypothetical protein